MRTAKGNGTTQRSRGGRRPVLITGGSGFVGSNLADRLLTDGRDVVLFDNLSRAGVHANARRLAERHGSRVRLVVGDVRDRAHIDELVREAGAVFHLAAQVAVTTSLVDPRQDFEVNATATLNVLEALRAREDPPPLLYTSTNKVYGGLGRLKLRDNGEHYEPADDRIRASGIDEEQSLDFHSPYGCSKGTADQYVLDYARSYGLPAVVFRMSCIYGPHQFGTEDQGWVAHFLLRALSGKPITVYGDGKQVRDLLFVGDLVDAMLLAERKIGQLRGKAFNIGGGPANAVSLLQVLELIGELTGSQPDIEHAPWRIGDQRYYVSDFRRFQGSTGWLPKTTPREGIGALLRWLNERAGAAPTVRTAHAMAHQAR